MDQQSMLFPIASCSSRLRGDIRGKVTIPTGTPARCNPISAPPSCTSLDIEKPQHLLVR